MLLNGFKDLIVIINDIIIHQVCKEEVRGAVFPKHNP
jgi:hypothetical protein